MIPQLNQCAPAWASSKLPTPAPGVCLPPPARGIRTTHLGPRGILFLQWVLGLGGGPLYSGPTSHLVLEVLPGEVQWGIRAPPQRFSPKSRLPTVAQPRGLSQMSRPGLTGPAGLSWEPCQETGPAVGLGDGDRMVSVQVSSGLGSECHGAVEHPPTPTSGPSI